MPAGAEPMKERNIHELLGFVIILFEQQPTKMQELESLSPVYQGSTMWSQMTDLVSLGLGFFICKMQRLPSKVISMQIPEFVLLNYWLRKILCFQKMRFYYYI